jgi:hypothetical protein
MERAKSMKLKGYHASPEAFRALKSLESLNYDRLFMEVVSEDRPAGIPMPQSALVSFKKRLKKEIEKKIEKKRKLKSAFARLSACRCMGVWGKKFCLGIISIHKFNSVQQIVNAFF